MHNTAWLDAHCHLWTLRRGDYDWLDIANPELAPIARDFEWSDLNAAYGSSGITQSILVQAAASNEETDYLLSIAQKRPSILGVVGWADLESPKLAEHLSKLASNPLCLGIRPMLQDIPDTHWILGKNQQAALSALCQTSLRLDALITPRHLEVLLKTCIAHPQLSVIINHAAKPDFHNLKSPQYQQWSEGMEALAKETAVMCKVSGLLTEMSPEQTDSPQKALAALKPVFEQLLNCFGPKRLVWGSDWPVLTLAADFNFWFEVSCQLLEPLSKAERQDIARGNAMRFYGLKEIM